MTNFKNKYRYLAQFIIETVTPLQIGSGNKSILTDSPVVRDINGLPYIPGTTLAGLIAHALGEEKEIYMGSQEEGSRIIVTEAKLLDKNGKALDGLIDISALDSESRNFLKHFKILPIRQHVKINHQGVTKDSGKFDEEVIIKGSRFCFEMEMISSENEQEKFYDILSIIHSPLFRIGSGSRSGFGAVEVKKCQCRVLNLEKSEDVELYKQKSSLLSDDWSGWQSPGDKIKKTSSLEGWECYRLKLKPVDFILFGSGFGNKNSDMTYISETYVTWNEEGTQASINKGERVVVIPASSVKGALSHRTAFHYNKIKQIFAEDLSTEDIKKHVGSRNFAVWSIFGSEGEKNNVSGKVENKRRGNILISDIIEKRDSVKPKVLKHVSIDPFTGGAVNGALFDEETLYANKEEFELDIMLSSDGIVTPEKSDVIKAFECALKDVVSGRLPLGGGVNRGNGTFEGKVNKLNKETKRWEELA